MGQPKWDIDTTHSSVGFSVRHLLVSKVRGAFTKWSGSLLFDENAPGESRVEVTIDAASVDTHEPKRDEHLRSGDFLDVARFPELTFKSTRVESAGKGRFRVTGDLTLHGVTREVVLDVEDAGRVKDPWGGERAGFSATAAIDRKEFGIVFNQVLDAGGLALGERIDVAIEIEAVKAAQTKAA